MLTLLLILTVAPADLELEGRTTVRDGRIHFASTCTAAGRATLPMTLPAGVWRIDAVWSGSHPPALTIEADGATLDGVRLIGSTAVLRAPRPGALVIRFEGGREVTEGPAIGSLTLRRIAALPGELAPAEPPAWVAHLDPEVLLAARPPQNPIPEVVALTRFIVGTRFRRGEHDVDRLERLASLDAAPEYDYPARLQDLIARREAPW